MKYILIMSLYSYAFVIGNIINQLRMHMPPSILAIYIHKTKPTTKLKSKQETMVTKHFQLQLQCCAMLYQTILS